MKDRRFIGKVIQSHATPVPAGWVVAVQTPDGKTHCTTFELGESVWPFQMVELVNGRWWKYIPESDTEVSVAR
jgi:hypothetical protein